MTDSEEILKRASKILEEHRTGAALGWFFNGSHEFTSTPELKFERHPSFKFDLQYQIADGFRLSNAENVITIVRPGFNSGDPFHLKAGEAQRSYGEVYVYFQEQLVLQLSARITHSYMYGDHMIVSTSPDDIEAMIAGPWIKLLPEYYDHLSKDNERRKHEKAEVEKRLRAEKVQLKVQLDGY